jgi:hypothetical protein
MNKILQKLSFWLILAAPAFVNTAHADEAAGKVKLPTGEVTIVRNGAAIAATPSMDLMAADKIITGPESAVGIVMRDGTLLSLGPKSIFQLGEFHFDPVKHDGNMFISLLKGSMRFVTGMLGKRHPEAVSIRVHTATIGIRGTDFVVSAEEQE